MINKLAYTLDMSFKISSPEKMKADKAAQDFVLTINSINIAKEHLDILHDPLKATTEEIPQNLAIQYRGKFNRFSGQVKDNFKKIYQNLNTGLKNLNYFSTDTQCSELINAATSQKNDTEKAYTQLIESLDDYKSSEFKNKVVTAIDNLKKEMSQLKNILERIISHLKENIAGSSSIDTNEEELEKKAPTVLNIYNKINNPEKTEQEFPQIQKTPQSLNFSDSQRVLYPQDLRETGKISK